MIWPWNELRRLRKELAEAQERAYAAEHWNEAPYSERAFGWATYPIAVPADTVIEKATISGPPWTVRLTLRRAALGEDRTLDPRPESR